MNESTFWKCAFVLVGVLLLSVTGCVANTSNKIAASPDPIAASCALAFSEKACLVAASRGAK